MTKKHISLISVLISIFLFVSTGGSEEREVLVGGTIMVDYMFPDAGENLEASLGEEISEGAEFRQARLFMSGRLYDRIEFKAQYDFAGGDAEFKDVYMGILDIPVLGGIRIGQFKEPFSLEVLTSSKYIHFMEVAVPVRALGPGRSIGFMIHNQGMGPRLFWDEEDRETENRLFLAAGIFKEADDFGDEEDNNTWNVTVRIAALPWRKRGGERLFHVGAAYSFRNPDDGEIRYRSVPEVNLAPSFVDTGTITDVESAHLLGGELALVLAPFSLQGEILYAGLDRPSAENPAFHGYYVNGSYFITGEHRGYGNGVFGRVEPKRPFLQGNGPGAWEVALRYSFLDLDDGGVQGGELGDMSVGLNWYLNAHARWMLNYVYSDLENVDDASFIVTRFQVDF